MASLRDFHSGFVNSLAVVLGILLLQFDRRIPGQVCGGGKNEGYGI
jgi:hypothetical protein